MTASSTASLIAFEVALTDEPGEKAGGVGAERNSGRRVQNHNRRSQQNQKQAGGGMGSMGALLQQAMKKK